jgi:hypothetical protein
MSKTFNFYCDESTHLENDGMPYMMIAYVSSAYNQLKLHKEAIKNIKAEHKIKGEIKWSNVSGGAYPFYSDLIDYFFSTDLNFRSIIVDKSKFKFGVNGTSYDDFYFRMYYQLIHHKVNQGYNYNIYLDIKDTRSHKKLKKLNQILQYNASIRNCQFIRSHESSLMQLTDLIMGAINYKLRGETKMLAKLKLIEKIESHCQEPITKSTPKGEDKFNLFFIDLK